MRPLTKIFGAAGAKLKIKNMFFSFCVVSTLYQIKNLKHRFPFCPIETLYHIKISKKTNRQIDKRWGRTTIICRVLFIYTLSLSFCLYYGYHQPQAKIKFGWPYLCRRAAMDNTNLVIWWAPHKYYIKSNNVVTRALLIFFSRMSIKELSLRQVASCLT